MEFSIKLSLSFIANEFRNLKRPTIPCQLPRRSEIEDDIEYCHLSFAPRPSGPQDLREMCTFYWLNFALSYVFCVSVM